MIEKELLPSGKEVLVRYEGELRRLLVWKDQGERIVACTPEEYERLEKGLSEPQVSFSRADVLDVDTQKPVA